MSVLCVCVCSKDKTKIVIKYEEVLGRFAPSQEAFFKQKKKYLVSGLRTFRYLVIELVNKFILINYK